MKGARYSSSRQKACQQCSGAKTKCDRKIQGCTRCAMKSLLCVYPRAPPSGILAREASNNGEAWVSSPLSTLESLSTLDSRLQDAECISHADPGTASSAIQMTRSLRTNSSMAILSSRPSSLPFTEDASISGCSGRPNGDEALDFTNLEIFCPIPAEEIKNRWLHPYIPIPGEKVKNYPATVKAFIYRMLKSYTTVTTHGRGIPPFLHPSQLNSSVIRPQLSKCLSLVRICEKPLPGSESMAAELIHREMANLVEQQGSCDDLALLGTFQAYLIYSLVLFFSIGQGSSSSSIPLRQAMVNLQDLACSNSQRGVMCTAEQQLARPTWEAWIVAEARRRVLFIMYMFDSLLSAQDGLPTYLGTELAMLLAPAGRTLWKARTRQEWQNEYNIHLVDWTDGYLRIDELWPAPASMGESVLLERSRRVDQWLMNVDEFGTMLFAVTGCTHGA